MFFHFKKATKVNFREEKFNYNSGDKVLLLVSYKSDQIKMENLLDRTGFLIRAFYTNPDKSYGLILCQPIRY